MFLNKTDKIRKNIFAVERELAIGQQYEGTLFRIILNNIFYRIIINY